MCFAHSSNVTIHIVFPSHFCTLGEVVNFLESFHALVNCAFNIAASPNDGPLMFVICSFSEPIVFKCESNQSHFYVVVELEIVTQVFWFVWPNRDRVDVGSKLQILLLNQSGYCRWLILRLLKAIKLIVFIWFVYLFSFYSHLNLWLWLFIDLKWFHHVVLEYKIPFSQLLPVFVECLQLCYYFIYLIFIGSYQLVILVRMMILVEYANDIIDVLFFVHIYSNFVI